MLRVRLHFCDRDLVGPKRAFDRETIYLFWSCPTLGRTQDDSRPVWPLREAMSACLFLIGAYFRIAGVYSSGDSLAHFHRIIAFHQVDIVAMTSNESLDSHLLL